MKDKTSGQMTLDFLVGFTVFIITLIWVASFIPGLLVGLSKTSGIDYNAVAYRTAAILVEDPGAPAGDLPWEQLDPMNVTRFGLAIDKDNPNILSQEKIERFFCTTVFHDDFTDSNDYRIKMLFSNYMYGYNVSLRNITPMGPDYPNGLVRMVGQPYPDSSYGYMRRYVMIKQDPRYVMDFNTLHGYGFDAHYWENLTDGTIKGTFTIELSSSVLDNRSIIRRTPYQIDLGKEPFDVILTNLARVLNTSLTNPDGTYINFEREKSETCNPIATYLTGDATNATLQDISCDPTTCDDLTVGGLNISVDGGEFHPLDYYHGREIPVYNTISLHADRINPEYIHGGKVERITLQFKQDNRTLILDGPLQYDYNARVPDLATGVLEVGIW